MKRVFLEVAYDGTNYSGWQIQDKDSTVEGTLNQVISQFLNENIKVIGASRTDSGVHALCNVAVFDTNSNIPAERLMFALNQWLPDDIRVMKSKEVEKDFHPRKVKSIKTYEYKIQNNRVFLPSERLYSHQVPKILDVEAMRLGAKYLCGEHDFTSFSSIKSSVTSKVRTIFSINIEEDNYTYDNNKIIKIIIKGNGFLYNMVRIIVGTLIEVGLGAYSAEEVNTILLGQERSLAGVTAPAKGLTLIDIEY